jgi:hypothetical protein
MDSKPDSNAQHELLLKKWEELKNLPFPESPGHPFLDNLYLELAEYAVYVSKIACRALENRERIDKESVCLNEDWNNKSDSFNSNESSPNEVHSSLKEYKQALDDFIRLILSSPE